MPVKARKVERETHSGQYSIIEAINASKRLKTVQKAILAEIIQYAVAYGCCRLTDAQLAKTHGGARETQNRRLLTLENLGLITRKVDQIHYRKRNRRIWIRWARLWKFLGIRPKDRIRKKRHIETPYGRSKRKAVNSPSTEAVHSDFKQAFYGCRPQLIQKALQIARTAHRAGQLFNNRINFLRAQLEERGATEDQIRQFSFELSLIKAGGLFS